ncbi:hypothetical protein QUA23_27855 [Microcoleus sp. Pol1C5]
MQTSLSTPATSRAVSGSAEAMAVRTNSQHSVGLWIYHVALLQLH